MKKFLTFLMVALMTTMVANAADLEEGKDYKWVKVKTSMTTVPADFCEGVSEAQAMEKADSEWGCTIYGNLPEEGGEFSIIEYNWVSSSASTKTWAEIIAAVEDWDTYYYPAKMERPADAPVLGVDFEWVMLTSENTTAPEDMCQGVIEYDAQVQLERSYGTGALYGTLPSEDGTYTVLYDDWGAVVVKNLTWDAIATLAADPWEAVYYPKALGAATSINTPTETVKVLKRLQNGHIVIEKNGKLYNATGVEVK